MIRTARDGALARLTLDRPEAHNALDQRAMREMTSLLKDLSADETLRALVVTGTGRSFCAGASLGDVAASDWSDNPLTGLCDALEAFPCPTIAALNGGVYGGGLELALACDFRIGVTGMKAFAPPARLGIHYEPAGLRRAIDRLGPQMTRRIFLLAERFDDEALHRHGFLDDLVAPEGLDARVDAMAEQISGLAPLAMRGMKRTILEISRGCLDAEAARRRVSACFASSDHAEGLAAQREKRAPRFEGR